MMAILAWVFRVVLLLVVALGLFLWLGPRIPVTLDVAFDDTAIGDDVDAYLAAQEARFDDITEGVEKRVIWAGETGVKTPLSVLYVHGFSATSEEIRPVPDLVAKELRANLIYTRLTGHGRPGAEMGKANAEDWMRDVGEALAVARAVGDEVVVISTSTGGTLTAVAALDDQMSSHIKGLVFVSPNFGINNPAAPLMTLGGAHWWLPMLFGAERSWQADSPEKEKYWTTRYPMRAPLVLAALVKEVSTLDFSQAKLPALFWFSDADQTVVPEKTRAVAAEWGGPKTVNIVTVGPEDDPGAHVVMGDLTAPSQTAPAVKGIVEWVQGL